MKINYQKDSPETTYCKVLETTACQNLWKSVLYMTMKDALSKTGDPLEHHQAYTFIMDRGKWFNTVCDLAGYEADQIYESFLKLSKQKNIKYPRRYS